MMETTEQIQDLVLADSQVPEISQPESPSSDEGILTNEIVELWQVHESHQKSIKHETEQFRALRNELGNHCKRAKEPEPNLLPKLKLAGVPSLGLAALLNLWFSAFNLQLFNPQPVFSTCASRGKHSTALQRHQ